MSVRPKGESYSHSDINTRKVKKKADFNGRTQNMRRRNGKPRVECVDGRHPPSKTPMDMPEWSEMAEQINWRAKQPSQVACFS